MALPEELYTVSELTSEIKRLLHESFPAIWVIGEVSNLRESRGHIYFTLKDADASISCAIWRSYVSRVQFEIEDGLQVIVMGRVDVFERAGRYQLIVYQVVPKGLGALQLAFIKLRDKLEKEGLFDEEYKKPIPYLPRHIGLVTSPSGAAVRDVLDRILRRFPEARVTICPARVQGEGAREEIVRALKEIVKWGVDVIILARGGGSIEDLWCFNEEAVARAIHACPIPVISAVGHERDFTIADFTADLRANTPTHAGEIVVPELSEILERLQTGEERLKNALVIRLERAREQIGALERSYALRATPEKVFLFSERLDELEARLHSSLERVRSALEEKLSYYGGKLEVLNPTGVLERGYSITISEKTGRALRSSSEVKEGEGIRTLLHKGRIFSTIREVQNDAE